LHASHDHVTAGVSPAVAGGVPPPGPTGTAPGVANLPSASHPVKSPGIKVNQSPSKLKTIPGVGTPRLYPMPPAPDRSPPDDHHEMPTGFPEVLPDSFYLANSPIHAILEFGCRGKPAGKQTPQ